MHHKKYRLLKDLPDHKAGEIFELNESHYIAQTADTEGEYGRWPRRYVENNPDWFEPAMEDEKILKYPNGSVVHAPKIIKANPQDLFYIDNNIYVQKFSLDELKNVLELFINNQNVFLTKEEAEKALKVQQDHNRLLKKIIEIDEQSDKEIDWYIYWDSMNNCRVAKVKQAILNTNQIPMSTQAKDYMMSDAVSDQEIKHFLFIYD